MDEKKELKPEETSSVVGGMKLGKPRKRPALAYGGPCIKHKLPIKIKPEILLIKAKYGGPAVKPIAKPEKTEEKEPKE